MSKKIKQHFSKKKKKNSRKFVVSGIMRAWSFSNGVTVCKPIYHKCHKNIIITVEFRLTCSMVRPLTQSKYLCQQMITPQDHMQMNWLTLDRNDVTPSVGVRVIMQSSAVTCVCVSLWSCNCSAPITTQSHIGYSSQYTAVYTLTYTSMLLTVAYDHSLS